MKKILILGGYGNFGKRISTALAKANIPIVIAGRSQEKAAALAEDLKKTYPNAHIEITNFDVKQSLAHYLSEIKPLAVINTCGPFQTSDYSVAENCIDQQVHYIDLADGRDFVNGIHYLNDRAKQNKVLVVSGASTVPGLSSAVLAFYKNDFSSMDSLIYGISPGQKAPRGLATTQGILTYLGKPLKPIPGEQKQRYGWQDLYLQDYPILGKRWMANCDIPDLDIFPEKYGIKTIRFSAGMENSMLHLGMWFMSWIVRAGAPLNLANHAEGLLRLSNLFNYFGTSDGGMHMLIEGKDKAGNVKKINWFIIAKNSDGPQIPCVPAIILAKKLFSHELTLQGAVPCVGIISLPEYLAELKSFSIECIVTS